MQARGLRRIVTATGSAARQQNEIAEPHPWLLARYKMMSSFNPGLLRDGEEHLRRLRKSGLDWTTIRAPKMTDDPANGFIITADPPHPSTTLPYESVANAMVELLWSTDWRQAAPFIGPA